MLNFEAFKFLAGVFTPQQSILNPLKSANIAVEIIEKLIDGELNTTILPMPKDAPPNIPRILLSSADKKWSLNISPERTTLFFNIPPTSDEKMISASKFSDISSSFFRDYKEAGNLEIQRIAFVTERLNIRSDSLDYVLNRFANEKQISKGKPFHNAKRFEIHSLKKYTWRTFSINSWVRIKFLELKKVGVGPVPGILVINDLNTLPFDEAPETRYSGEDVKSFLLDIPVHLEEILQLYFD